jgi:acetylornithine deacetylase/succinyl-diaminopimelate desuccinylase-like protein
MGDLQAETARVLSRLIRFDTVNPPGNERACQEWLRDELTAAGFECTLVAMEDETRPNLVARLAGAEDGPSLGFLSHVDTVLATAADWQHDPWSGEEHDGFLWGRGAIDMKSQTAAEVVAAIELAKSGWRPARGELKVIAVVDEETGGRQGAKFLCEEHPDLVRVEWLLNEGGGAVMPYGDRRLYGVGVGEKGTFRFTVSAAGRAGHASVPALCDNALLRLLPAIERFGTVPAAYDITPEARAFLAAIGEDDADPGAAVARLRDADPRLAALVEPLLMVTFAPTMVAASDKINVVPARASLKVDGRIPPGLDGALAERRAREVLAGVDGIELDLSEDIVIGNRSAIDTPLMDAIAAWLGEEDPAGEPVPWVLPAFTDSRWFRAAFPGCAAYGFFPQRHQHYYDTWSMMHAKDERIDVRDLGVAARFYVDVARRLLG